MAKQHPTTPKPDPPTQSSYYSSLNYQTPFLLGYIYLAPSYAALATELSVTLSRAHFNLYQRYPHVSQYCSAVNCLHSRVQSNLAVQGISAAVLRQRDMLRSTDIHSNQVEHRLAIQFVRVYSYRVLVGDGD